MRWATPARRQPGGFPGNTVAGGSPDGAAKWQAAASVVPGTGASSGSTSAQTGAAFQHRVRNRQPDGRRPGEGTSPASTIRGRRPRSPGSGTGAAEKSACV
jgi:hypothetical protein